MNRPYPHLRLTRWPFQVVPEPDNCTFLAARNKLRDDVHSLVQGLARRDASSINLFWAWFGAGKTHTLHYLAYNARAMSGKWGNNGLYPVYTEIPKGVRSFFDVYKSFAAAFDQSLLLDAFLEVSTAEHGAAVHRRLRQANPDLMNALQVLATGTPAAQGVAQRWLKGDAVPVGELRKIGVSQKLSTSEAATRILASLVELLRMAAHSRGIPGARLIWILDEFQRIAAGGSRVLSDINSGLHTTFNSSPTSLSLIFSFSGKPQSGGLPPWFSEELRDRIGPTKVMLLPPMTTDEALKFVREVLAQFRVDGKPHVDPLYPFTESSCLSIISEMQTKGELKPRSIMQAFSAVLEAADVPIESRAIEIITPALAKQVLANYTFVSKDEDAAE